MDSATELAVKANPLNALAQASDRSFVEKLEKGSFKLPIPLKARVMQICDLNGTDFSSFLRECCENLRAAHDGPQGT